ncbi:MAG: primosomal protein N' [Acidobacteriota bacterium]|nr:primosomal protein N' [Acidobacteriota bacterium]
MIARVIPLTRTRAIRGLFDYLLPGATESAAVGVGSLLRVPFAGRTIVAVVAEMAATSQLPADKLQTLSELLPARLPADLVELAVWMAAEYCSTPARALQILLPAGAAQGLKETQVLVAAITDTGMSALEDCAPLTDGQRAALQTLAGQGPTAAVTLGGAPLLRRLESRGLVTLARAVQPRRPATYTVSSSDASPPPLTGEQESALAPILEALDRADGSGAERGLLEFLLHGVTGSGKTEVYLRAAQRTLEQGRSVIILVPEIALTPQALARFRARFGDVVAVMHSGMSAGKRHDEWLRLARGEARVAVGPRSAVFAPLTDVGLIVVDEEHESSYKHESDPRYDARTVAAQRARRHQAVLLSGSATPRPETVFAAKRLIMRERVDGGRLPTVEILDMRGLHNPLHPDARLALADCRRDGGKAIVLLNRRGWSNFLSCGSCGRVWMCPNCEVALVLHRSGGYVACHHCGHRERVPSRCPDCGSVSVARHGAGTERLEHELVTALADASFPVLRLDADAAGLDARAAILERFHAAASGVLVGTQMVAKGHDFADVGLGIVVDADQTLRFPDFRAEERTFALVTQLAGRTGRGVPRSAGVGRVLVQTLAPTARPITLAAQHDSETFVRGELRRRKALGYPPFATMIRVVCAAVDRDAAHDAAAALRERIGVASRERIGVPLRDSVGAARQEPGQLAVLGPAPLFMLRGKCRYQLVVKAADRAAAVAAVRVAVDAVGGDRAHREVALSVDVDPQ